MGALTALSGVAPVALERWFAAQGAPPPIDLARSGAPDVTTADVLALAGDEARDEYLRLPLGYGDPAGTPRLRAAVVAAGHARRPDEVLVTSGAVEALLLAVAAVTSPGDRVAVGVPAYGGLVRAVEAAGAIPAATPVWRPDRSLLDLRAMLRAVAAGRARSAVVNSPHNPSGAVAVQSGIGALAALCAARGGRVVVDEVALSTLDPLARSVSAHPDFGGGAIVAIGDVSKSLGLGGLRIGWLTCADPVVLRRAAALKDVTTLAPSAPAQHLAAVALEQEPRFRSRIRDVARANREALAAWTTSGGAACTPPADGLVAFPLLAVGGDAEAFASRLRVRVGVSVTPGGLFGVAGHVRIGLGVDPGVFSRGLDAITEALP